MEQSKEIVLELDKYAYQNKDLVLKDISVSLHPGKIHSLIGPSGCGKSTLLRVLMGMEMGACGNILTASAAFDLKRWSVHQRLFSMVPQVPHLFPWKTILDNVSMAVDSQLTTSQSEKKQKALQSLDIVGLLDKKLKYPYEISLGMAQRVAFARALVQESQVLLLDEPFASVDAYTRHMLQKWLVSKIKETNRYALLVTHDIQEAIEISDQISVLSSMPATKKASFHQKKHELHLGSKGGVWIDSDGLEIGEADLQERLFSLLSASSSTG